MMNVVEFIKDIEAKGVELWVEDDRLRYRSAKDVLTPAILTELKQHKAEILELYKEGAKNSFLYPLSYAQHALWFLYQLAPASAAYNVGFTARIRSRVDVPALQRAFQSLIARHLPLRATFAMRGSEPVQEIHKYQQVCFEKNDASQWKWDELRRRVVEAYQRPFDLELGPVLRVNLFTRSEQDHILLLTLHHIVCDAWSLWLLLDELRVLYPAELQGTKPKLPALELSYKDYVRWQTRLLASSEGERLWSYWRSQLGGELPVLDLPTDRPRPLVQTFNGASHTFKLTEELTRQLTGVARAHGATLYMTLLTAFLVLLYRYTGQEEIVLGTPTSGRSQTEFVGMVGDFINTLVLRVSLTGNPTFKAFLTQVRQTVLGALSHQDFPFSLLVERLQPKRDPSRLPLFQVLFNLQRPQQFREVVELWVAGETGERVEWGGLSLEPFKMAQQEGQLDLTLEMVEAMTSLFGVFKYNPDLFDAGTINRMEGHFQTLLESVVANPEQPVSQLPLLTEHEQRQLLVEWNHTQSDYPRDKCIHQLFEDQAKRTPEAIAAVFEDQQLTYCQVDTLAEELANRLKLFGVAPNGIVGFCVERSLDMLVGILGILKSGAAYLPLDPDHPKKRLDFILKDAGVTVLVTHPTVFSELSFSVQSVHAEKSSINHSSEISGLVIICLDGHHNENEELTPHSNRGKIHPDNPAYIMYTSGSTGDPKGVQIPHRGVVNFLTAMSSEPGMTERDTMLAVTTLSFDISVLELMLPLIVGGRVVIAKREVAIDGLRLSKLITESGATIIQATPATWRLLVESGWQGSNHLKILCGGEALPSGLAEKLLPLCSSLWNMYGPTETTVWSIISRIVSADRITIGRPIANTETYVLNADNQLAPIGVAGELYIGGEGLADGYLNRPSLTEKAFVPHPFTKDPSARLYKTGDLVRYRPNGDLEFLRRVDHQVKIRGYRIELGEIEAVISRHPGVREAVAIIRENALGNKGLVVYIISHNERPPSTSELRNYLKEYLPEYMVPSTFVTLEEFPLNPNGKIDRKALPEPEQDRPDLDMAYIAPQNEIEKSLVEIWSEVLGLKKVGVQDDLFDLGGHSLTTPQLASRISKRFSVSLPILTFFQHPTIREISEIIDSQKGDAIPAVGPPGRTETTETKSVRSHENPMHGFRFSILRKFGLDHETFVRGATNRILQLIARVAPTRFRPALHRWRGVTVGSEVLIGYDTIIETSYPWLVSIGDDSGIGMRVTIIAHFASRDRADVRRGNVTVEIGKKVWIGPGVIILPNVKIGDGAVVGAGSIVNMSIAPWTFAQGNPAQPVAKCGIPLTQGTTYDEFIKHLEPL
jgi:amino acid adenylation domain-containing protein